MSSGTEKLSLTLNVLIKSVRKQKYQVVRIAIPIGANLEMVLISAPSKIILSLVLFLPLKPMMIAHAISNPIPNNWYLFTFSLNII